MSDSAASTEREALLKALDEIGKPLRVKFARDRLEEAVAAYVKGGFQPHDIARLVSEIATEQKDGLNA